MKSLRAFTSGIGRTGVIILAGVLLALTIIPGLSRSTDDLLMNGWYALRGEVPIDTSIVVIYFSGEDLSALGGLPLKRNYYALVIDVLRELGASLIGVDIAFTEEDREHQEYDRVLSSTVRSSGNVVLGAYFRSIVDSSPSGYPAAQSGVPIGHQLGRPFRDLNDAMAGLGHTNLLSGNRIPVMIYDGNTPVLALAAELFRRRAGVPQDAVALENGTILMFGRDRVHRFPSGDAGAIEMNYPGDVGILHARSVIEFLKSYDSLRLGQNPAWNPDRVKGKTVLLGIAAEGRTPVVQSPYSDRLPSLALHAFMLDNLLRNSLMSRMGQFWGILLALPSGLFLLWFFVKQREGAALAVAGSIILAFLIAGYVMFVSAAVLLPVAAPIIATGILSIGLMAYRHRLMGTEVDMLTRQRDDISRKLEEKELTLAGLEQQLSMARGNRSDDRIPQLAAEIERYKREIQVLRAEAQDTETYQTAEEPEQGRKQQFHSLVYASGSPMESVVLMIQKVAASDATVLLSGESGTGKELVARAIHESGNRASGPFIAVNCGALTETLLESELFGHERGAFTGAVRDKQGRFELADRGTIFLDEITETSEAFQVKLLRVLQEGTIERVGGATTLRVDVRVIASTNRDIRLAIAEKKFREDLFYRLNVIEIDLPPLREREGDIPLLAGHFLDLEAPDVRVSTSVMAALKTHTWKGNVRELQSTVKRAVLLAGSEKRKILRIGDFPAEIRAVAAETRDIEERIVESLREKGFARSAISETAEELGGMNRGTVAEYFRGYCFRIFVSMSFSFDNAVDAIAGSEVPAVKGRAAKKLIDYLQNAIEFTGNASGPDSLVSLSKPKYKNLPQRYHPDLDALLKAYALGEWQLPIQTDLATTENA